METTSIFRAVADFSALDSAVKKEMVLLKALTDQVKAYGATLDATLAKGAKLSEAGLAGGIKRDTGLVSSGGGALVASDATKVASGIDKQMAPTTAFLRQLFTNPQFISSMAQMEHALTAALPTAVAGGLEGLGAGADHVAAIAETSGAAAGGVADIGGAASAAADEFKNADESAVGMGGALEGSTVAAAGLGTEMVKVIDDLAKSVDAAGSLTGALLAAAAASRGIGAGVSAGTGLLKDAEAEIPHLAGGGIVDKPTVALLGEDGTEAVISDKAAVEALRGGGSVVPANVGAAPVAHVGAARGSDGRFVAGGQKAAATDTVVDTAATDQAKLLGEHLTVAATAQGDIAKTSRTAVMGIDAEAAAAAKLDGTLKSTTAELLAQKRLASTQSFTKAMGSGGVTAGVRDTHSGESASLIRDERSVEKETGYLGRAFTQGAEAAKPFFQGLESGGVLAVASIAGIVGIGGELVKMGLDFNEAREQSENTFEAMGKTTDQAKALVATITDVARGTPFLTSQVQAVTQQMMVMGFTSEQVISGNAKNIGGLFKSIGDAAAAQGPNASQALTGISTAFGRIQAQGGLTALTMRTLVNNGVPAAAILEKAFHLTAVQVANITKQGLSAQQEIDALSAGMEQRFGGSMAKAAGTFHGELMTIKSDLSEGMGNALKSFSDQEEKTFGGLAKDASSLAQDIGDMGFMPAMQKDLPHVAALLSSFVNLWHSLYAAVSALTPVIKTFVGTLGATAFVLLEGVLKGLTVALTAVAKIFGIMPTDMRDTLGVVVALSLAYSVLDDKFIKLWTDGTKFLGFLKDIVTGQKAATAAAKTFTDAQAAATDALQAVKDKGVAISIATEEQRVAQAKLDEVQVSGTASAKELAAAKQELAIASGRVAEATVAEAKATEIWEAKQASAAKAAVAPGASGLAPVAQRAADRTAKHTADLLAYNKAQAAASAAAVDLLAKNDALAAAEVKQAAALADQAAAAKMAAEADDADSLAQQRVKITADAAAVAVAEYGAALAEQGAQAKAASLATASATTVGAKAGVGSSTVTAAVEAAKAQAAAQVVLEKTAADLALAQERLAKATADASAAFKIEGTATKEEIEANNLLIASDQRVVAASEEVKVASAAASEAKDASGLAAGQVAKTEAAAAASSKALAVGEGEVGTASKLAAGASAALTGVLDTLNPVMLGIAAVAATVYVVYKLWSDHTKEVAAQQFQLADSLASAQAGISALNNPVGVVTKGMDAFTASAVKANAASLQFAQTQSKTVQQLAADDPAKQQLDLNKLTADMFAQGSTKAQVIQYVDNLKTLMGPALTATLTLDTSKAGASAKTFADSIKLMYGSIAKWTLPPPAPTVSMAGGKTAPSAWGGVAAPPHAPGFTPNAGIGNSLTDQIKDSAKEMTGLIGTHPDQFFQDLGASIVAINGRFTVASQRTLVFGTLLDGLKAKGSPLAGLNMKVLDKDLADGVPWAKAFTDALAATPGGGSGALKDINTAVQAYLTTLKGAPPTQAGFNTAIASGQAVFAAAQQSADDAAVAVTDLGHVFDTTGPLIDSTLPDFSAVSSAFTGLTDTTSAWTAALTDAATAVKGLSSAATAIDVSGVSSDLGGSTSAASGSTAAAGPSASQTAAATKDTKAVDAQKAAIDQLRVSQAAAYQQALKGGTVTKAGMAALKAEQLAAMEAADAKLAGLNKVANAQTKANAATKAGSTATKAAAATDTLSLANVTAAIAKQVKAQQENNAVTAKYGPAIGAAVAGIDKTGKLASELLSASPAQAQALIGELQTLGGAQQKYATTTTTAQSSAATSTTQSAATIAAQLTATYNRITAATANAAAFGANLTAITKTYGATVASEVAATDPTGKLAADIEANPSLGKKVVKALQDNATEAAAASKLTIKLKTEVEIEKDPKQTATQIAQEVGGESADDVIAIAKQMGTKTTTIWAMANAEAKGQAPAVVLAYTAGLTKGWNDNVPGVRTAVENYVNNGVLPPIATMSTALTKAGDLAATTTASIIAAVNKANAYLAAHPPTTGAVPPMGLQGPHPLDSHGNPVTPGSGAKPPGMAEGGIVSFPTIALLGEAGAEAVVPLRGLGSMADITKAMFPSLNPNLILRSGAAPTAGIKHSGTQHNEHHEVHQTNYNLGGVVVETNDPNAMFRALQRKAALRNGTAAKL